MTRTRVVAGALLGVAAVLTVLLVPIVAVELDESATPTAAQARLPRSLAITSSEVGCGSGGCWLDVAVDTRATTGPAIDDLLALDGRCEPVSALDRRSVCTDVEADEGDVVVHISFRRVLGL